MPYIRQHSKPLSSLRLFTAALISFLILNIAGPVALAEEATPPAPSPIIRTSLPTFKEGTKFVRFDGAYAELQSLDGKVERLYLGLEAPKYWGMLKTKSTGKPYFLFEGQPCAQCKMERKLYLFRGVETKPDLFTLPGKIVQPEKNASVFESRSFFGKCLNGYGDVLVTFQREHVDRRRGLRTSVFIAEPGEDHLIEKIHGKRLPSVSATIAKTKKGECTEIDGKKRAVASRLLDDLERMRRKEMITSEKGKTGSPSSPPGEEDDDSGAPLERDFPDSEE